MPSTTLRVTLAMSREGGAMRKLLVTLGTLFVTSWILVGLWILIGWDTRDFPPILWLIPLFAALVAGRWVKRRGER